MPPRHPPRLPSPRPARGLTMVEAMCMLLAVGLVAALALPRMAEQQSRTRVAQLRQAAQALQARLDHVRERAQAHGFDCHDAAPRPLPLDGGALVLTHCQPHPDAAFGPELLAAAPVAAGSQWQVAAPALTAPRLALERADAPQPARCALSYAGASGARPARVELLTAGC